jgi:hypothetical protein
MFVSMYEIRFCNFVLIVVIDFTSYTNGTYRKLPFYFKITLIWEPDECM